ncbi:MAG: CheB methylesterase domain-containing protein [Desulfuromonadaceae bacterium]|nr:CheB methylesterase domain-containing protein [Desulfuromonadaceae bacterium]MDD2855029.1 CheB methylesterase domain-containing protein [Desulfuromonadaceae bacterium]
MKGCNIVMIGASTGGLKVLEELFPRLPVLNAAVIIIQHITPLVDRSFAKSLSRVSRMPISLAEEGTKLHAGQVYLAPGGIHLTLVNNSVVHLHNGEKVNSVRPSIDVAMKSVSTPFGIKITGVILTGMGGDGAAGISHIKKMGGVTISQDQKTSVIYGMPKAAVETGKIDFVLPTNRITDKLKELFG